MRIIPISDLHVDKMRPGTLEEMIEAIPSDIDVLVVAGDVSDSAGRIPSLFQVLCERFKDVIYVLGNHEYYHNSVEDLHDIMNRQVDMYTNLHWLDNSTVTLGGVRFVGSTLWFPFQESNKAYERPMSDFGQIPEFREWVYGENQKAQDFLQDTVCPDDVVITHFLPSDRSVAHQYMASPFNRFFVCPMDSLVEEVQPRYWIHGHTHSACLYKINKTSVVCNPFGYEIIDEVSGFCPWLILEIEV